jgi:hypothetical protein
LKEQSLLEEVKKMEMNLVEQEKHFKALRESNTTATSKPPMGVGQLFDRHMDKDVRRKEVELAKERGIKVVEFQTQRDRLEKERVRIMDDLEKLKSG